MFDWGKSVGEEARKNFSRWVETGFYEKYLSGDHVLDVGFAGYLGRRLINAQPQAH